MSVSRRAHPPALILCAQIAALALTRRLGRNGIAVGLWDRTPTAGAEAPAAMHSRFARWRFAGSGTHESVWADQLFEAARVIGGRPVLIPTSDDTVLLISRERERLAPYFRFLLPAPETLEMLLDKRRLHQLAARGGVAVPRSIGLHAEADLDAAASELGFPCLLKSAYGKIGREDKSRLPGKVKIADREQLHHAFGQLSACDDRLMLQEFLEGGAEQVALYNAYFDAHSQPVAVFTGRKLRQYPPAFGTACASEACPMPGLAEPLTAFLQHLGYVGPIDIGLKWDARTNVYKLLDVNPRLGQNYRTYVAAGPQCADLGWLTYAELAGWPLPAARPLAAVPRRWRIEDDDFRTCRDQLRRGVWNRAAWLKDLLRFQCSRHESAFWSWQDPAPFLHRALAGWRRRHFQTRHPQTSLRAAFNAWAERGDAPRMERQHRTHAEHLFARMQLRPGHRVLDIGCGSAWATLRAAAQVGASGLAVGLDISDAMLRLAARNGGRHLTCASADHLPFPDATFTHILSVESFYYLPDPQAALAELRRVLAPGGQIFLLMCLYRGNPYVRRWRKQIALPVQLRSPRQWQDLLASGGWTEVRVEQCRPQTTALPPAREAPADGHAWACLASARHPELVLAAANQSSWSTHPTRP